MVSGEDKALYVCVQVFTHHVNSIKRKVRVKSSDCLVVTMCSVVHIEIFDFHYHCTFLCSTEFVVDCL